MAKFWKFSSAFWSVVLAIFFGFISGILGLLIFGFGNFSLPIFGTINYNDANLANSIIIQQPRSVVVGQDTQIKTIEANFLPAVVSLYRPKKSTDPLTSAYNNSEILGYGLVFTADGWIISSASALNNSKNAYTAIGYQNKKYQVDNIITDEATGIVFAKMPASNLPVAKIGRSDQLSIGQTVAIVSGRDRLVLAHIAKIGYAFDQNKDLILNSDSFKKRIYLSELLENDYEGSMLLNLKGEVVGVKSGDSFIPVDYFSNITNQVLIKQKISRASLGLDYLDLAQVDGLIDFGDKGAYVAYEPLKTSAVYGLVKRGDIIKRVNDVELNAFVGLVDVINNFKSGDKIELLLTRGDKDLSVNVILK